MRLHSGLTVVAGLLLGPALSPWACSSSTTNPSDTGGAAGTGADAGGDASPPVCNPDETPGAGVFVSATAGDDTSGDGSKEKPFASIGLGITTANAAGKSVVYVAHGSYAEAVTVPDLPGGLVIDGGWTYSASMWSRDCTTGARDKTVIEAPAGAPAAVHAIGIKTTSGLKSLTVRSADELAAADGQSGRSSIAVRADDSIFSLTDVVVIAGRGGNAGAASNGADGTLVACNGYTDCSAGSDGASVGVNGSAASTGTLNASGYLPGDGTPASSGDSGQNGTPGGGQNAQTCSPGCHDSGCGCAFDDNVSIKSGAGRCGCGGGGGEPGTVGRGGGASIALLASGSGTVVNVLSTTLTSSDGGDGSPGGSGGQGVSGSSGAKGGDAECVTGCSQGACGGCYSSAWSKILGGDTGGPGGAGQNGGSGGPGSGGSSFAVATGLGAKAFFDLTTFAHGSGGVGASNAAMTAPNGDVADRHDF